MTFLRVIQSKGCSVERRLFSDFDENVGLPMFWLGLMAIMAKGYFQALTNTTYSLSDLLEDKANID